MGGIPRPCTALVAKDPEVLGPIHWKPCFDGRDGCRQLAVDWGDWREAGTLEPGKGTYDKGRRVLVFHRPAPDGMQESVVFHVGGPILAGLRTRTDPYKCPRLNFALTAERAVVGISGTKEHRRKGKALMLLRAPWSKLDNPPQQEVLSPRDLGGKWLQRTSMSQEMFAAEIIGGWQIGRWPDDGTWSQPDLKGDQALWPVLVGRHVYYETKGPRRGVRHIGLHGEVEPYLGGESFDVAEFDTDGEHATWVRAYGRQGTSTYERMEVWTSPYASNAADLQPHKLLDLGAGTLPTRGTHVSGPWVILGQNGKFGDGRGIIVIRLRDGAYWLLEPPDGYTFWGPLYLTEDELALAVFESRGNRMRTIFRIDLNRLGPPKEP